MLKILKQLNTNLNLLQSLTRKIKPLPLKIKALINYLKQRKLLTATIVIVLVISSIIGYNKLKPQPIEEKYQLATAEIRDIKKIVNASGTIKSQTEANLRFQTSGQLVWVNVKKGDSVTKWQAIAGLDTRELEKTLVKYLRDYSKERHDFEEDIGVTYDQDNIALTDTIRRVLEKNQWDLDKAILDVELKNIALKYATLVSPIDGVITRIDSPVGGVNITPATAIFTVVDPANLTFEAEIDELDIGFIQLNNSAELILDAYPDEPIPLIVDSIDFSSTTDSGGSTIFIVKFNLSNPDLNKYRVGMNGEINVIVNQEDNVLVVPTETVSETDSPTIQLVEHDQIINQPVTTGLVTDDYTQITSGLNPGDTIVVYQKKD